jgi:Icc-related predicted phosphoesterase
VQTFKILQIGDIHLARDPQTSNYADWKDSALPENLAKAIIPNKLQLSLREAVKRSCNAVFFCGDITDRGDFETYRKGISRLIETFDLKNPQKWKNGSVHCVPGNHDLCRKLSLSENNDCLVKFSSLEEAWGDEGVPIIATRQARIERASLAGCNIGIVSLNSCIGCGEKRHLPAGIRNDLAALLEKFGQEEPKNAFGLLGEQLDTPAFLESHLQEAIEAVQAGGDRSATFILTHHNILPQALPRLEVYTDLLNGGLARSRLTSCQSPVIYCHGHIHEDPIETIGTPTGNTLVCVSAPKLEEGFNEIELEISHTGFPLGCIIHAFRWQQCGLVGRNSERSKRVPLQTGKRFAEVAHPQLPKVIACLTGGGVYFPELCQAVNDQITPNLQKRTLATILREAEWLNFVEIQNRDRDCQFWQVTRQIP